MQAVQDLRSTDLSMWTSRYNLFVLWSADRQHPWDGLPDAEAIAATLEIGKADQSDKVGLSPTCPTAKGASSACSSAIHKPSGLARVFHWL